MLFSNHSASSAYRCQRLCGIRFHQTTPRLYTTTPRIPFSDMLYTEGGAFIFLLFFILFFCVILCGPSRTWSPRPAKLERYSPPPCRRPSCLFSSSANHPPPTSSTSPRCFFVDGPGTALDASIQEVQYTHYTRIYTAGSGLLQVYNTPTYNVRSQIEERPGAFILYTESFILCQRKFLENLDVDWLTSIIYKLL